MWTSLDRPGELFNLTDSPMPVSIGQQLNQIASASTSATLALLDRSLPHTGEWYSSESFFFNMSLGGRPSTSRGRFPEVGMNYRTIGDLLFVPKGTRFHAKGDCGRQHSLFIELRANLSVQSSDLANLPATSLLACLDLDATPLKLALARIVKELREPGFASELTIEGLSLTALAEAMRLLYRHLPKSVKKGGLAPWRHRLIDDRVRNGAIPTITELAGLCGLSCRQLMRAYHQDRGETLGAYVQRKALERAKIQLVSSRKLIGEIATEAGFKSATAFSTAFRRSTGECPRNYRNSELFLPAVRLRAVSERVERPRLDAS